MIIKVACRVKKHHLMNAFLDYLTVYEREYLLMLTNATNLSLKMETFLSMLLIVRTLVVRPLPVRTPGFNNY